MNIAPNIRAAILATPAIANVLSVWEGEPAVHTRRPLPENATYPLVAISPDVTYNDQDFLSSGLDVVTRDIFIIGRVGQLTDDYRVVEQAAYAIRELFHRNNTSLGDNEIHIVSVNASGPRAAPVDDTTFVGRVVTLTIRMQKK